MLVLEKLKVGVCAEEALATGSTRLDWKNNEDTAVATLLMACLLLH